MDRRMQTLLDTDHPLEADPLPGGGHPPWAEGMTHACENIALLQTSFAGGNKDSYFNSVSKDNFANYVNVI